MPRHLLALLLLFVTAPCSFAQAPFTIHTGLGFAKATREECALTAVHLLGAEEDFIHVEVMPDGNAYGWNESMAVLVVTNRYRDGVRFCVTTVSRDNTASERVRNLVRDQLASSTPLRGSARTYDAADEARESTAITLQWATVSRTASPILKYFVPAAFIAAEKQALHASNGGLANVPAAFGADANRTVFALLLPGPNEIGAQLCVIAAAEDRDEAERLKSVIMTDVLKILFE